MADSGIALEPNPRELPSGMVTFLFTDIEGSTRRWESDPAEMRAALASHDAVLVAVIEGHDGQVFKHTGDGVIAAFASADRAVKAAIEAQLKLKLPVRMGLGSGEVQAEEADYFGPTLNRAARVMSAGHGGQILLADSTEEVIGGFDLVDLGPRRLRDLSEPIRIFQVRAEGLGTEFPPLKTVDTVPGNLPVQATSFIGRKEEVGELVLLVESHRLVTLTGFGGVGKTRLATQVAAELTEAFADGVWLVELAAVSDPNAVPDLVATALGVTRQAGISISESLALALAGRRLLIVFDNCEHVLDSAAKLINTILQSTTTVSIIATSREALRLGAEHRWPVPTLGTGEGASSAAVSLFIERAREACGYFELNAPDELEAVTEICEQLDGVALAIELAAARMVTMSVQEVRDRLGDRFRLLSGGRRGLERHQTLLHAVQWSYDLLTEEERDALCACSVFSDGFVLEAIGAVYQEPDEYVMLDLIASLVRKSLVTVDQSAGSTRYGLLETIRQFCGQQLGATGRGEEVRDRHVAYFANQTLSCWNIWDGPRQLESIDWVDHEFANLRTAFRWAADHQDFESATTIAAHAAIMIWPLQRFEPVGWAEEILGGATAVDVAQLPRLYTAASLCLYSGRPDHGAEFARKAVQLGADGHHDPFEDGWAGMLESLAHLFGGRIERRVEISRELASGTGFARVVGLCGLTWALPAVGREEEAMTIADETLAAARSYGSPFWIGWALGGYGRAFAQSDPVKALAALREGLDYAEKYRLGFWQANLAQDAARLEATHGDLEDALGLFSRGIDSFHRAGNIVFLAATLASLAVFFDRVGRAEVAATIYGFSTRQASIGLVPHLDEVIDNLKSVLGEAKFIECVSNGKSQDLSTAVRYAHEQIDLAS